jgi:hypothetical protein
MSKYVLYFGVRSTDDSYSHEVISKEQYDELSDAKKIIHVLKIFYRVLIEFSQRKVNNGRADTRNH